MSAGPVNTFGMQKAHLNVERGPGYPTPGVLQKEAASCWKQRKRVQKRAQRDDKRLQTAENTRFAVETQRHRGRGTGSRYTPVATGSMRNVLRTGEILAPRGAYDGRSRRLRENTRGGGSRKG